MESSLLMWRFFTFIMVTDCVTEFCLSPPNLRHATFKAITYQMGTLLNCECKKGFRRSRESTFMNCTENAGHSAWENQCQCKINSLRNTQKQATPKPEEQKERKTTEMQSQTQPTYQVNLLGHCREPPPWEHEASTRIYHFVVGQTVHYECAQGFRAVQKGPATSTCQMIGGETRWTQPQLKCTSESENDQFLGDEEFPAITDTPSGSEASRRVTRVEFTTTDFQKYTEVSTTTEMFIFTIQYQIAVAGCILLLISIFLLSALTWQRRRKKSGRTL